MLNLIQHGADFLTAPVVALPSDFENQLQKIGYTD